MILASLPLTGSFVLYLSHTFGMEYSYLQHDSGADHQPDMVYSYLARDLAGTCLCSCHTRFFVGCYPFYFSQENDLPMSYPFYEFLPCKRFRIQYYLQSNSLTHRLKLIPEGSVSRSLVEMLNGHCIFVATHRFRLIQFTIILLIFRVSDSVAFFSFLLRQYI